jgi:hypothetical protein
MASREHETRDHACRTRRSPIAELHLVPQASSEAGIKSALAELVKIAENSAAA